MSSELAGQDWIEQRWGGFTYLVIGRNEDFCLEFQPKLGLWLRYETDEINSPVGLLLLFENPTQQDVIDAERMFGCR